MKALLTLTLTLISPAWAQEELEWIDDLEAAKKASKCLSTVSQKASIQL